jgi:hypothetical protein
MCWVLALRPELWTDELEGATMARLESYSLVW